MTLFSLTPTFTQGLVLGKLSILLLLAFILRYLFFETNPPSSEESEPETDTAAMTDADKPPRDQQPLGLPVPVVPTPHTFKESFIDEFPVDATRRESLEWFNLLLNGLTKSYRAHLHGNLTGTAANEAARRRIERWAQTTLQSNVMSPIKVHSVSLGTSSPKFTNARIRNVQEKQSSSTVAHIDEDLTYTDTLSMSLSTSLLLNYPTAQFARLPISLTLSLSIFSGTITLVPPSPSPSSKESSTSTSTPKLTIRLQPNFKLSIDQSSLMGSRAKLADVPKVHQIIQDRIRTWIETHFEEYQVMLPLNR